MDALRLVRQYKGRLVLTPTGRRLAGDTAGMWRHVITALPLGKRPHERHAGVLMLLAFAAGEDPYNGVRAHGTPSMWAAGWAVGGQPPEGYDVLEWARPTWTLLLALGERHASLRAAPPADVLRNLARDSLRLPS